MHPFTKFRRWYNLALILCLPICTWSQSSMSAHGGSVGLGMNQAFICLPGISGMFGNPANLTQMTGFETELMAQNRFLIPELRELGLAAGAPLLSGFGGLSIRHFGFAAYREQLFQAAFARNLAPGFDLGIRFDAGLLTIAEYGNRFMLNGGVGVTAALSRVVKTGIFINHPFRQNALVEEFMPPTIGLGISYSPAPQFLLLADAVKYLGQPISVQTGIEYRISQALHLRTGASLAPARFAMGLGINFAGQAAQMNLASSYHPYLGLSPSIGVKYKQMKQE